MEPTCHQVCTLVTPRVGVHAAALGGGAAGLAGMGVLACAVFPPPAGALATCLLVTAGVAIAADLFTRLPEPQAMSMEARRSVSVSAGPDGLRIGDAPVIPRTQLLQGFLVARPGEPPLVVLCRRIMPAIRLEVESERAGCSMLRSLGLDARQSALTVPASWPRGTTPPGLLLGAALLVIGGVLCALAGSVDAAWMTSLGVGAWALTALVPVAAHLLFRPKLVIGKDGVCRSYGRRTEFVPYAEIQSVERACEHMAEKDAVDEGIAVNLRDGRRFEWMVEASGPGAPSLATWVVIDRIRRAMATFCAHDTPTQEAVLGRRGRSAATWREALAALGSGATMDHRTAAVTADQLLDTVDDPAAPLQLRAGAAVALSSSDLGDAALRLRAAALATAEPTLRAVLQAAASGDEGALALAFERCGSVSKM